MCSVYEAKLKQRWKHALQTGKRWQHDKLTVYPHYEVPIVRLDDRQLVQRVANWSFLPKWELGKGPRRSTHNAQSERLNESRLWSVPWNRGLRCLIPASAFFESQDVGAKYKRKWKISVGDQEEFCFAGMWRSSTNPQGEPIDCCTIITLPAGPLMSEIHNTGMRQPVILEEDKQEPWLAGDAMQAQGMLKQLPDELLIARPLDEQREEPQATLDLF